MGQPHNGMTKTPGRFAQVFHHVELEHSAIQTYAQLLTDPSHPGDDHPGDDHLRGAALIVRRAQTIAAVMGRGGFAV